MVEEVNERLAFLRHEAKTVLIIGELRGELAASLRRGGADVDERAIGSFDEAAPWPGGGYDLIVALNTLDTINDLPGALLHMRAALAPGGIAIAAMPGAGSLPILRAVLLEADDDRPAARIHPQIDAAAGAALLQRAGFRRQVADSFPLTLRYRAFGRLIDDLRDQGLTSCLSGEVPALDRAARDRASAAFVERCDDQGTVDETIEIVMLTAWA